MSEPGQTEVKASIRTSMFHRLNSFIRIAMLAGAILGYWSLYVDSLTNRMLGHPTLVKDGLAILCGGAVGLISALFFVPMCLGRDLRITLPVTYGMSLIVVTLTTILANPFLAALIGFVYVITTSFILKMNLPRTIQRDTPGKCGWCGYDLTGGESTCCPECGRDCDPDTMSLAAKPHGLIIGESRLREYLMKTWSRRLGFIVVLLFMIAIGYSRYLAPHFSPARFEQVHNGMTLHEVRRLLGRLDRVSISTTTNEQVWIYEQGGIALGHCLIGFTDEQVSNHEIYGW